MKTFVWTFVAVFVGIYAFTRLSAAKSKATAQTNGFDPSTSYGVYAGPEIDPQTGAYLPSGSGAGTVNFAAATQFPGNTPTNNGNAGLKY